MNKGHTTFCTITTAQTMVIKEMLARAVNANNSLSYSEQFADEDEEVMFEQDRADAINQLITMLNVETY